MQTSPKSNDAGGILSQVNGPNKLLPTIGLNKGNSETQLGPKTPDQSGAYNPRRHTNENGYSGSVNSHLTSLEDEGDSRRRHGHSEDHFYPQQRGQAAEKRSHAATGDPRGNTDILATHHFKKKRESQENRLSTINSEKEPQAK